MENPKNKLEVIECPEEEPGEFILQKYCKRETRAKYRYGVSYAQFLGKCQETVLNAVSYTHLTLPTILLV